MPPDPLLRSTYKEIFNGDPRAGAIKKKKLMNFLYSNRCFAIYFNIYILLYV